MVVDFSLANSFEANRFPFFFSMHAVGERRESSFKRCHFILGKVDGKGESHRWITNQVRHDSLSRHGYWLAGWLKNRAAKKVEDSRLDQVKDHPSVSPAAGSSHQQKRPHPHPPPPQLPFSLSQLLCPDCQVSDFFFFSSHRLLIINKSIFMWPWRNAARAILRMSAPFKTVETHFLEWQR